MAVLVGGGEIGVGFDLRPVSGNGSISYTQSPRATLLSLVGAFRSF